MNKEFSGPVVNFSGPVEPMKKPSNPPQPDQRPPNPQPRPNPRPQRESPTNPPAPGKDNPFKKEKDDADRRQQKLSGPFVNLGIRMGARLSFVESKQTYKGNSIGAVSVWDKTEYVYYPWINGDDDWGVSFSNTTEAISFCKETVDNNPEKLSRFSRLANWYTPKEKERTISYRDYDIEIAYDPEKNEWIYSAVGEDNWCATEAEAIRQGKEMVDAEIKGRSQRK